MDEKDLFIFLKACLRYLSVSEGRHPPTPPQCELHESENVHSAANEISSVIFLFPEASVSVSSQALAGGKDALG